jgi:CheY-specific phosphatase CheX
MLAWLTIHVRGCDQKILKNEPIGEATTLKEPDQAIAEVMKKLLTGMYNIAIPQIVTRRYSGEIRGTVIIRLVMSVEKERHMLLFGMPERLAKTLYNRISGIFIQNIEKLDEMEESALLELGDIMASYILGSLTTRKITEFAFEGEIYLQNYQEKEYNLDNVVVDVDTKYGTMEVLYCQISL